MARVTISHAGGTRAMRRLAAGLRWGGAIIAACALVGLGLLNPPSQAHAASTGGYDQMSGTGSTATAITVPWTKGLLNADNQPITSPGSELNPNADRATDGGELSFMDADFQNLVVTVSQTQNIGHAGITVSWTGGLPTALSGGIQGNYLQMMECYGNASTGPSPEDCEYGEGLLPQGMPSGVGTRIGDLCSSPTLSSTNPTGSMNGSSPAAGCDPNEPTTETPTHYPCTSGAGPDCLPDGFNIPFLPEGGTASDALYQNELPEAFDQFSTNEVDVATTRSDGTGQQQFETVTSVQSSGLGCGQEQGNGTPQGCWLVIVPRGHYEPNGYAANIGEGTAATVANELVSTPLSAGNWAQRIQVHLDYAKLPTFCQIGGTSANTDESYMEGSQLITRAVQSWELELNEQANCSRIYHMAETPEQEVTNDFVIPVTPGEATNGLAFTTDPVGSDRLRNGESLPTLPNIVYAPVGIVGIDFGFHIDEREPGDTSQNQGYLTTPINLSPQLLARALTQTYQLDLPDYDPQAGKAGPAWVQSNPQDISKDPLFQKLNPEVIEHGYSAIPLAPLDTVDHSAYYQQLWQWVQADSTTSEWLDGATEPSITLDPSYESEQLGKAPAIDSVPRSYPSCLNLGTSSSGKPESRCSIDMLPYVTDFDAASADVLAANPLTYGNQWDPLAIAPDDTSGYWDKNPPEPPGQIFEWAIDATPYTAAYGLVPADLCNDSGSSCVAPTIASVTAAVNDAKPDSAGLLEVNPADPGTGAYPLTEVVYAAVRTDMPAQQLTDYADFISFAANQGQTTGQAAGNLPPGYLPLTSSLQAQANAVVTKLRSIAAGGAGPTGTPTPSKSSSSSSSTPNSGSSTTGSVTGGGGTQSTATNPTTPATPNPASQASATPAVSASGATPTGPVIVPPTVQLAAGTTPGQPVGPIRQVLVVVVIVGIAGAGGGILLRRGRLPRWPGRPRP